MLSARVVHLPSNCNSTRRRVTPKSNQFCGETKTLKTLSEMIVGDESDLLSVLDINGSGEIPAVNHRD